MTDLTTPWTTLRQARAERVLERLDAVACSAQRLLAWNEVDSHRSDASCVAYWMARSQRGVHNLALDCAVAAARSLDLPLVVVFRRFAGPTGAQSRHVEWMLRGLVDAFVACAARGAHVVLVDQDGPDVAELCGDSRLDAALVITDDDVMPRARRGRDRVARALAVPLISVDADVVVPGACIPTQQYAARTIRPRIHRVLDSFEHELGSDSRGPKAPTGALAATAHDIPGTSWFDPERGVLPGAALEDVRAGRLSHGLAGVAGPLPDVPSGTTAAKDRLADFVAGDLHRYDAASNHPELDAGSRLSRFIRFGQISPMEVVAAVRASDAGETNVNAFIEQFVVRRELAYNFVRWNPNAHRLAGAPEWARRTLEAHRTDPREWVWDHATLESGDTHDPLWNAAQRELVETGYMHGYVRMYWAKKVLEWREDPSEAFDLVLAMNDCWLLDGRDPNGIVGVAWAIGGVHDRPWGERPVFGTVRYMSLASTGRKFDSRAYVARWGGVRGAAVADPGRYGSSSLF